MSFTGVGHLDHSIDTTNAWLGDVADEFGTEDRRFAYRVTRAWLHALGDRLPVSVAAHFAAQLPELLRGVLGEAMVEKVSGDVVAPAAGRVRLLVAEDQTIRQGAVIAQVK